MYSIYKSSGITYTHMKALTDRQRTVLEFLRVHSREHGFPPTLREIGQAIGLANISAVQGHLAALVKKGYIAKDSDKARSIRVLTPPSAAGGAPAPSILSRFKRKLHEVARTDEGVVHRVVYAIALATRRRRMFFTGRRRERMVAELHHRAVEHGWRFLAVEVQGDHVAVAVEVWPSHSPELVARRIRAVGSTVARKYPGPDAAGGVWARGYAVTTEPERLDELLKLLLAQAQAKARTAT